MSGEIPLRMRQAKQPGPVSGKMEQLLQRERERFEEFARENRDGEKDEALLEGDEPDLLENPIVKHYEHDPDACLRCAVSTVVTSGNCSMLSMPR
jgi:3-polyprenyl-4-hydroxybenzoate decarboxylase